ncbi:hypothetical protein [Novosphingobium sp. SG916]|uniref:hypothetical protein n=1 Tax=unclassified Novosphingobium TaxID=2644732 RepID=UPI0017C1D017|nr:hypothetical protein [Novosphingobium sp. SG919]NMN87670.1 hypothetical protein [Novosphingobium sp. SG916]
MRFLPAPAAALLAIAASLALAPLAQAAGTPTDALAPTGRWSANARGQAPTPPMGWNSWNAFGPAIDETKLMASAQALVDTGLAAKGYRYVDIDDGWWLKRRMPDGRMLVRTAMFPSAATPDGTTSLRPLTDRLHAMGLKAGIYSDIGRNSCSQVFGGGRRAKSARRHAGRTRGWPLRPYRTGHRALFPGVEVRPHQSGWLWHPRAGA